MRGLSKPWPPSNVSPDGQAPRRFTDAEREYLAALPDSANSVTFAKAEFDRLVKAKLRQVMYSEQGSLCVYCEQEISENDSRPHVEHWRPRSRDPEHALHWRNLYLSCSTKDMCGDCKGDKPLKGDDADPHLPWPTELDYERLVGFTSGGEMYVRVDVHMDEATRRALELAIDDGQQGGIQRQAILNLNHPALVEARRGALDSERTRMEKDFRNRTATRNDREGRASQLLGRDQLPKFVSIRVAWLRKALGRGR